jgi:DNA polymerase epsilon subunit 1
VFERHVPLIETAVQRVGCVATLRRDADAKDANAVLEYDLDDLEMRTTAECGYVPLADPDSATAVRGMMRHVSLYRAGRQGQGRLRASHPSRGIRRVSGGRARRRG